MNLGETELGEMSLSHIGDWREKRLGLEQVELKFRELLSPVLSGE